jgi:AraC-like DNA-binding protein
MKPKLLKIQAKQVESFSARHDLSPAVNNLWHYHEELELIFVNHGEGTCFIGDHIGRFKKGECYILGTNLPHYWRFDADYFTENGKIPDIYAIHFNANFLGAGFLEAPENRSILKLTESAKRGLKIKGSKLEQLNLLFKNTIERDGFLRLQALLQLLYEISINENNRAIASVGFKYNYDEGEQSRMQDIYNYTLANYKQRISLKKIAEVANISPNSFCKFFKSRSRKNFTDFVNEIRIGQACKLLVENKLMISQICFESGFNNPASFHKCFKEVTGKTPLQYQKAMANSN